MADGRAMLFCDPRFHDLNEVPAGERRRIEHVVDGALVGALDGVVRDGVFDSGHSAPFGGPDLADPDPPLPAVLALLEHAVAALDAEGVGTIRIRARPAVYSPVEPMVEYGLLQLGFAVAHCDFNQHVALDRFASVDDYLAGLKKKRRAEVRADLEAGFELREAIAPDELATCHGILAANRAAHGRPPGLPLAYLERALAAFPGRIHPLVLSADGAPVAAAIVYDVLDDVDLLVAWGDHGHGLRRSPMNLLAYRLVERALARGARLLDLGPSSEKDGRPNPGLVQFKRSVGGAPGTRLVLVRSRP
jgi:hypothetical protein